MLYYVIENGVLRELLLVVTNTPADKKHFFVKKTCSYARFTDRFFSAL